MPQQMRSVLYGSIDYFANSRDAAGETGRRSLRAAHGRFKLCDFWSAGASGVLCRLAADPRDVRCVTRGGAGFFAATGASDGTGCYQSE